MVKPLAASESVPPSQTDIDNLQALLSLQPLITHYLPWSHSSLSPAGLRVIANEVVINHRQVIVELGGGISTLVLANLIDSLGADRQLLTIEHDADWLAVIERHLANAQKTHCVNLFHAPLTPCPQSLNQLEWYDLSGVETWLTAQKIDLLVIDGPPAYRPEIALARYPALPVLREFLADSCAIFLDDGDRPGEQAIARHWQEQFQLTFEPIPGNMLRATLGSSWNIL
jgi:predicted O-methyltransferase YrrM